MDAGLSTADLRLRFSLRSLMWVITLVCFAMAPSYWFGWHYLRPALLSLAMAGGCFFAFWQRRPVVLFAIAGWTAALAFYFAQAPLAWYAVLAFVAAAVCLLARVRARAYGIALLVFGVASFAWFFGPDVGAARQFHALRTQYPLRSVASRLEFEAAARGAGEMDHSATAAPVLSAAVQVGVDEMEFRGSFQNVLHLRGLTFLHNATYREFIASPGFGFERMRGPLLGDIGLNPRPEIALPLTVAGTVRPVGAETLTDVHKIAKRDFLARERIGYVRSRDEVAGFESHGFEQLNEMLQRLDGNSGRVIDDQQEESEKSLGHWQLERLELVSLLRHEEPRVYVSKKLPQMDQLADIPQRSLDEFESTALSQVQVDENLVIDAQPDHIRMLGAIRAGNDCLQCHGGERGQLLGAFSYELKRVADLMPNVSGLE